MKTTQKGKQSANYANSRGNLIRENSQNLRTNIPWLQEVPEGWEVRKIKYLFSERIEKGFPDELLLVASQNMGVVPKDVYGSRTVEAMKDLHLLKLVEVGDFVISLRSFQGGIEYAYYRGIISPAYTIMKPNVKIDTDFFRYLAKSRWFIELLQMCVTGIREGQNIDYGRLKNEFIPLPPLPVQSQIANFLDTQVSKIDKLIEAKRRQIKLLKEWKRANIDEELKIKNEELKEVPLKRLLAEPLQYGANESGKEYNENLPRYVRITDITLDGQLKS
ncbi:MAG: restriction endonuclease subunit S, partial [Prevotellaceae bacterium]|nr:restriction endonuclease subunit S [Prevotellaceae bacterium]